MNGDVGGGGGRAKLFVLLSLCFHCRVDSVAASVVKLLPSPRSYFSSLATDDGSTSTPCSSWTNVSTFDELSDAITNAHACVDVIADITFTNQILIKHDIEITTTTNSTLDGGMATRFFTSKGLLVLRLLILRRGSTVAQNQGYGGAIYMSGGELHAIGCTFSENGTPTKGGAVYISSGTHYATGCTFSLNSCSDTTTTTYGGAMYISGGSLDATECTFVENSGGFGGALYSSSLVQLTGCCFSSNAASFRGGACYFEQGAEMSASTFDGNSASVGGGRTISASFKSALNVLSITSSSFKDDDSGSSDYIIMVDNGALQLYYVSAWNTAGLICSSYGPNVVYNSEGLPSSAVADDTTIIVCDDTAEIAPFCDPGYCSNQRSSLVGIECYCSVDGESVDPNLGSCLSSPRLSIPTTIQQLQITKPWTAVASWVFANQGGLPLVWSLEEQYNPERISTSILWSARGNLSSCDLGNVSVSVPSAALQARQAPYGLLYRLQSNSHDAKSKEVFLNLTVLVSAAVHAAMSNITLLNASAGDAIVAGSELHFFVDPVDLTGQTILQASTSIFYSSVALLDGISKVVCEVTYDTKSQKQTGVCKLPELKVGSFALSVIDSDGDLIGNRAWRFECNACPKSYYYSASDGLAPICELCPETKVDCLMKGGALESLKLMPGYYRYNADTPAKFVIECPYEGACTGGPVTGDDCCAKGYTSVLCGACAQNYYESGNACKSCSSQQWSGLAWALVPVAIIVGMLLLLRNRRFRGLCEYLWSSLGTQAKTVWSGAQILSAYPSVMSVVLPKSLRSLYSKLDATNLNPAASLPLACIHQRAESFFVELVATTTAPIVVALAIWAAWFVRAYVLQRPHRRCYHQHLQLFLLLCYLTLPSVCTVGTNDDRRMCFCMCCTWG